MAIGIVEKFEFTMFYAQVEKLTRLRLKQYRVLIYIEARSTCYVIFKLFVIRDKVQCNSPRNAKISELCKD